MEGLVTPSTYEVVGEGGRRRRLSGWRCAYWEDYSYERLKNEMRERPDRKRRLVEKGRRYTVFELEDGKWALVTEVQNVAAETDGTTKVEPPHDGAVELFETMGALLRAMRKRWQPDDEYDPYSNLLTDWGNSDVLDDWRRDVG